MIRDSPDLRLSAGLDFGILFKKKFKNWFKFSFKQILNMLGVIDMCFYFSPTVKERNDTHDSLFSPLMGLFYFLAAYEKTMGALGSDFPKGPNPLPVPNVHGARQHFVSLTVWPQKNAAFRMSTPSIHKYLFSKIEMFHSTKKK